ncbi:hypothetical protein JOF53_000962 [Crossiella equi]|uniref:Uncharacterized protein n=1 Tax=Crossiella equi TaxID=130796 RepID=A0ABS5A8Q6_9PSEU|nr:hypothetical protein [Crossiella equi]MBP2472090.1 hypothetical protein [Crossiella equi]
MDIKWWPQLLLAVLLGGCWVFVVAVAVADDRKAEREQELAGLSRGGPPRR